MSDILRKQYSLSHRAYALMATQCTLPSLNMDKRAK